MPVNHRCPITATIIAAGSERASLTARPSSRFRYVHLLTLRHPSLHLVHAPSLTPRSFPPPPLMQIDTHALTPRSRAAIGLVRDVSSRRPANPTPAWPPRGITPSCDHVTSLARRHALGPDPARARQPSRRLLRRATPKRVAQSMDHATFRAAVLRNLEPDWASLARFSKSGGMPFLVNLQALSSSPAFQLCSRAALLQTRSLRRPWNWLTATGGQLLTLSSKASLPRRRPSRLPSTL